MPILTLAILFAAGVAAGVINTVAGGGSVLTLPALIFAGIPATAANATNRIGIIFQNAMAIRQFRRGGVSEGPLTWRVAASGLVGSGIGALLAARIPDEQFEVVLGLFMLALLPLTLMKTPKSKSADGADSAPADHWGALTQWGRGRTLAGFFLLGVYGGFLQAGIGIMILLVLAHDLRLNLIQANYVKLVFVMAVTALALAVFLLQGVEIFWIAGLVLTAGQVAGAYIGSWLAIRRGERWIRIFMVASILLSSAKLLGFLGG